MKLFPVLLVICLIVLTVESQNNGRGRGNGNGNGKGNGQGRRKYKHRPPSSDVGARLRKWKKGVNKEFPHEMGADEYNEFDIMVPPAHAANYELPESGRTRWTNGIIPYLIIGTYSPAEVDMIKKVMQTFADNTCVRFVPWNNEALYLKINNSITGCWSHVGMYSFNDYNLANLQNPNCMNPSTITHELMHAVGFHHEFTRPDRDDWISIDTTALALKRQTPEWIQTNFGKMSTDQADTFGIDYYYGSCMHYSKYAGAWNYSRPVVMNTKPWERNDFGCLNGLTAIDIKAINRAYECPGSV
ncbi:metalloproteinase [Culex quinquefasciatus]|uniref:Metalloendopeptidase n=1 Tax=Culex quinquefasciatus TaxID=7176 RepID=B0WTS2_CULQU|nr:metalloproteinase [Culex quinquefasciatus]|eukprot:XP_001855563.1 metalloproteinase [Culex quinquefasciatus]